MSCYNVPGEPDWNHYGLQPNPDYAWTDITWLLHAAASAGRTTSPTARSPTAGTGTRSARRASRRRARPASGTRCPGSTPSSQDGQLGNIQPLTRFKEAVAAGTLPAVSWVIPNGANSEHPPGLDRRRTGVRHRPRQRPDAIARLVEHGHLPDLGRLGRLLRPRGAARRRRQRLRPARPGHGHQPVREAGLHRPPDAELRRLPEVHRGRLPRRSAHRPGHRRPARPAAQTCARTPPCSATCATTSTSRSRHGRR